MTVGDDDVVSASSLVLSSGLSYLLQAAKFFTLWRNILRHGVKITPQRKNLAVGGEFRGQAPNLVPSRIKMTKQAVKLKCSYLDEKKR